MVEKELLIFVYIIQICEVGLTLCRFRCNGVAFGQAEVLQISASFGKNLNDLVFAEDILASRKSGRFARARNRFHITLVDLILDVSEFAIGTKWMLFPTWKALLKLDDSDLILADHASGAPTNRRVLLPELRRALVVMFLLYFCLK